MVLWSTAQITASHPDLQAMCLACSGHGTCALISRRCIHLFRTDNLNQIQSQILRETKWDTAYAEFSPARPQQMACTQAQQIQIYNIDDQTGTNWFLHTLGGHTRTITDLNWSYHESWTLASASYDNYIYVWDLRETRRPAYLMHSISGATQIKWSRCDDNLLATSHEGDVRIWDKRKSNTPLHYVSTHLAKINGIDWSPFHGSKFLTYSQDGNIKLWDLGSCARGKCEFHMNTSLPIWKARYTPFGNGLLTALVPQMRRAGENNSLWMWKIDQLEQPIHSFAGHLDVVLDFGWNYFQSDSTTTTDANESGIGGGDYYELITWARDNTFRMWKVNAQDIVHQDTIDDDVQPDYSEDISSDCDSQSRFSNNNNNLDLSKSSNLSSPSTSTTLSEKFDGIRIGGGGGVGGGGSSSKTSGADFDSNFDDSTNPNKSDFSKSNFSSSSTGGVFSLKQEFSLFNANIPNIVIEELNISKRTCIASIKSSLITCRLKILFPANYPATIPQFSFLNDSANSSNSGGGTSSGGAIGNHSNQTTKHLNDSMKKEILKVLQATATLQVQRNRNCLEKCLRQFVQTIERLTSVNLQQQNSTLQNNNNGSGVNASGVAVVKPQPTVYDILTSHKYGSYLDASVPFPRTSGARFCSSELLVCFGRPPHLEQMNVPTEYTPRSLSALSAYLTSHVRAYSSSTHNQSSKDTSAMVPSISSFYIDSSKKHRSSRKSIATLEANKPPKQQLCGPVMVFSASRLLPISRHLAEQYYLPTRFSEIINVCEMNSKIASTAGRKDLIQTWNLVRYSVEMYLKHRSLSNPEDLNSHWSRHPFGGRILQSLIEYYVLKCNDVQMAAMIASVISACKILDNNSNTLKKINNYNQSTLSSKSISSSFGINNLRSIYKYNSYDDINNDYDDYEDDDDHESFKNNHHHHNSSSIFRKSNQDPESKIETTFDSKLTFQYDYYKKIYADILYRWRLIKKRSQLLKTIETKAMLQDDHHQSIIPFGNECKNSNCRELCQNYICSNCNRIGLNCIICRLPVKGATNHCLKCGHGGHTLHMEQWFQHHRQCPSGCGCDCLQ